MATGIEALELQITEDSSKAIQALNSLVSTLNKVKGAVNNALRIEDKTGGISRLAASLQQINVPEENVSRLERLADTLQRIKSIGNVKTNISIGGRGKNVDKVLGQISEDVKSGQIDTTSGVDTQDAASGFSKVKDTADSAAKSTKELNKQLKETTKTAKGSSGVMSKLASAFGRIAFYRAIRSAIKAITEGFKTGINNVYEYSKAVGTTFAGAMDAAKASVLQMKNSLGAALAPALVSLLPLIQTVVNWIITLANAVNQFLALLGGQSTWTRATAVSANALDKVKSSAGGASGAIKGLLADFDELNIIQSQGGGGGGGGGVGGIDYESMFEEVDEFNSRIKSIADKIKPIIQWCQDHLELVLSIVKLIGAAFIGWKLSGLFTSELGKTILKLFGIALAIHGTSEAYEGLKDQFENGINWDNFTQYVNGAAEAIIGLGAAFGVKGIGAGLLAFGLGGIVSALYDIKKNGEASKEAIDELKISIGMTGIGTAILTKSWIPLVVAAIGEIAIAAYENKDKVVGYVRENFQDIVNMVRDASLGMIAVGAMLAFNPATMGIGLGMLAAGMVGFATSEYLNGMRLSEDIDEAFRQIMGVVAASTLALGAILLFIPGCTGMGLGLLATGATALFTAADFNVDTLIGWLEDAWNQISSWAQQKVNTVRNWFYNNVTVPIANSFLEPINKVIRGINKMLGFTMFGELELLHQIEDDVGETNDQIEKNTARFIQYDFENAEPNNGQSTGGGRRKKTIDESSEQVLEAVENGYSAINEINNYEDEYEAALAQIEETNNSAGTQFLKYNYAAEGIEEYTDNIVQAVEKADIALDEIKDFDDELQDTLFQIEQTNNSAGTQYLGGENVIDLENDERRSQAIRNAIADYLNYVGKIFGANEIVETPVPVRAVPEIATENDDEYNKVVEKAVADYFNGMFETTGINKLFKLPAPVEVVPEVKDEEDRYELLRGIVKVMEENDFEFEIEKPVDVEVVPEVNDEYPEWYTRLKGLSKLMEEKDGMDDIEIAVPIEVVPEYEGKYGLDYVLTEEDKQAMRDAVAEYEAEQAELETQTIVPSVDSSEYITGIDNMASSTESAVSRIVSAFSSLSGLKFSFLGTGLGGLINTFIPHAATGGMFTAGQMFIARESGPELVGSMGNKTTVANNNQIVSGITAGVSQGQAEQNALLRQQNDYLRRILAKESTVKVEPSAGWGKFQRRSEQMYARNAGV